MGSTLWVNVGFRITKYVITEILQSKKKKRKERERKKGLFVCIIMNNILKSRLVSKRLSHVFKSQALKVKKNKTSNLCGLFTRLKKVDAFIKTKLRSL